MYPNPPQPEQPPQPAKNKKLYWIVGIATGLVGLCCVGGVVTVVAADTDQPDTTVESAEPEPVVERPEPAPQPPPEPEPAPPPEPELTVSQEQAVGSAESYLAFSGFSRSGLIEQLQFEGFSEEDATFAVDYIEVDWMAQAVRVAQSYLDYSHFSRQGLIDQLVFEGFTAEQAEHGADEVGL